MQDDEAEAVRELVRVLRPGGFLVISNSNLLRLHWLFDPIQLRGAIMQRRRSLEDARRPITRNSSQTDRSSFLEPNWTRRRTPGEMRRFLSDHNLEILEWDGVGFGPFTFLGRHIFSFERSVRLSARLEKIARRPGLRRLSRLAGTWVLTLAPRRPREERAPLPGDGEEALP